MRAFDPAPNCYFFTDGNVINNNNNNNNVSIFSSLDHTLQVHLIF